MGCSLFYRKTEQVKGKNAECEDTHKKGFKILLYVSSSGINKQIWGVGWGVGKSNSFKKNDSKDCPDEAGSLAWATATMLDGTL